MAAALLFVSSPWTPDPGNTTTVCSGYHSGALEGGQGRESGSTCGPAATPPKGVGTQSHDCGPLARQVLPKGGVRPVGHGGLVRCPIPHPAAQPSWLRCRCAVGQTLPWCIFQPRTYLRLGLPGTLTVLVAMPAPVVGRRPELGPQPRSCRRLASQRSCGTQVSSLSPHSRV